MQCDLNVNNNVPGVNHDHVDNDMKKKRKIINYFVTDLNLLFINFFPLVPHKIFAFVYEKSFSFAS